MTIIQKRSLVMCVATCCLGIWTSGKTLSEEVDLVQLTKELSSASIDVDGFAAEVHVASFDTQAHLHGQIKGRTQYLLGELRHGEKPLRVAIRMDAGQIFFYSITDYYVDRRKRPDRVPLTEDIDPNRLLHYFGSGSKSDVAAILERAADGKIKTVVKARREGSRIVVDGTLAGAGFTIILSGKSPYQILSAESFNAAGKRDGDVIKANWQRSDDGILYPAEFVCEIYKDGDLTGERLRVKMMPTTEPVYRTVNDHIANPSFGTLVRRQLPGGTYSEVYIGGEAGKKEHSLLQAAAELRRSKTND